MNDLDLASAFGDRYIYMSLSPLLPKAAAAGIAEELRKSPLEGSARAAAAVEGAYKAPDFILPLLSWQQRYGISEAYSRVLGEVSDGSLNEILQATKGTEVGEWHEKAEAEKVKRANLYAARAKEYGRADRALLIFGLPHWATYSDFNGSLVASLKGEVEALSHVTHVNYHMGEFHCFVEARNCAAAWESITNLRNKWSFANCPPYWERVEMRRDD